MLEGKLIGLAPVEPARIKTIGYLQSLRDLLRQKHKTTLEKCYKPPTFLLEIPTENV